MLSALASLAPLSQPLTSTVQLSPSPMPSLELWCISFGVWAVV